MEEEPHNEEGFSIVEKWFELMNIEKFKTFYDDKVYDENDDWIKTHNNWTNENHIKSTPTIFINSYQKPTEYNIEDLKIILPTMIEELEKLEIA